MGVSHSWLWYFWRRVKCVFLGHKPIKWDTSWEGYGSYVVICARCRAVLEGDWGEWGDASHPR